MAPNTQNEDLEERVCPKCKQQLTELRSGEYPEQWMCENCGFKKSIWEEEQRE